MDISSENSKNRNLKPENEKSDDKKEVSSNKNKFKLPPKVVPLPWNDI